mgnify:CR=1 FL=1
MLNGIIAGRKIAAAIKKAEKLGIKISNHSFGAKLNDDGTKWILVSYYYPICPIGAVLLDSPARFKSFSKDAAYLLNVEEGWVKAFIAGFDHRVINRDLKYWYAYHFGKRLSHKLTWDNLKIKGLN